MRYLAVVEVVVMMDGGDDRANGACWRGRRTITVRAAMLAVGLCTAACPVSDDPDAAEEDGTTTSSVDGSATAPGMSTSGSTTTAPGTGTSATVGTTQSPEQSSSSGEPSGCGVDPGFTGIVSGAITAAELERRFILVLPDDYDPSTPYPLVFMLHGRGSNAEQLRSYAGVEEAAADAAIFVYPEGLPVESMGGVTGWELGGDDRDVALIDALLADFTANLCVDGDRVFASGHSFGGFFSNALGCVRGDIFRGVAPVAGGGPGQQCSGQVATWITHGDGDTTVTPFFGEMSRNHWVGANNCDAEQTEAVDPAPCEAYQGCDDGYPVHWCFHTETVAGLGAHLWPSFAGEAIWSFFSGL